jgi:hypothetical protein
MKHARLGESLWNEWEGAHYEKKVSTHSYVLFTEYHVDVENETVKRALASALQRFGMFDSLGQSYSAIENRDTLISIGYSGYIDGDTYLSACDELGHTYLGDEVDSPLPTTWVEIRENGW